VRGFEFLRNSGARIRLCRVELAVAAEYLRVRGHTVSSISYLEAKSEATRGAGDPLADREMECDQAPALRGELWGTVRGGTGSLGAEGYFVATSRYEVQVRVNELEFQFAMKTVTIIQTRMGSTRLPGKVMKDLGGHTVLARVVRRLRRSTLTGEILIATTTKPADDVIVEECRHLAVEVFRGEENDVLDRYYQAAKAFQAEAVVRITSDCPMIEPEITDNTIRAFLQQRPDYASNALKRTYPRGLDTEIMTLETLERAWRNGKTYERVHVTPYVYENPDQFKILSITGDTDYSNHRWTLDTPEDLEFIRAVYERMGNNDAFYWRDVLAMLEREPELVELNRQVAMKPLQDG